MIGDGAGNGNDRYQLLVRVIEESNVVDVGFNAVRDLGGDHFLHLLFHGKGIGAES